MEGLSLRAMEAEDAESIKAAFARVGWLRPLQKYRRYFLEQQDGAREVLVAEFEGAFAGHLSLRARADYRPFRESDTVELQDLHVLPRFRRRGVASALLEAAEHRAARLSGRVGIGVGVSPDYGPAQRLYARRGYLPDGRGLTWHQRPVQEGELVRVDDKLVFYLCKDVPAAH